MKIVVLSCSINPGSRSNILAHQVIKELSGLNIETQLIDLRTYPLAFCDGTSASKNENSAFVGQAIKQADAILMAVPIYNFDVNAATKNLVEVTGDVWNDKLVGFMCAAGGRASYMSVMGIANSLMLDFRCLIVPRFVYATKDDFTDIAPNTTKLSSNEIKMRLKELARVTVKLAEALPPIIV